MILVTVGNALQPFIRLLSAVEALAAENVFGSETVLMQTGHATDFHATYGTAKPFWPLNEFEAHLKEASHIITHGGCTVLEAVAAGKLPIVMPRMRRHGEHVNDHQILFTRALASQGRVIPAYEADDLRGAVAEALRRGGRQDTPLPPSHMRSLIRESLDAFNKEQAG